MCIVRRLTLSNLFIFCVSEKQTFIDSTHFFLIFVNNEKSSRAREHLIWFLLQFLWIEFDSFVFSMVFIIYWYLMRQHLIFYAIIYSILIFTTQIYMLLPPNYDFVSKFCCLMLLYAEIDEKIPSQFVHLQMMWNISTKNSVHFCQFGRFKQPESEKEKPQRKKIVRKQWFRLWRRFTNTDSATNDH